MVLASAHVGPDLVGLSQDGTKVIATGYVTTQPWSSNLVDCATTGTCGTTTMSGRSTFAASYSRALGAVFVAGGKGESKV